jgi:hypothetical protein
VIAAIAVTPVTRRPFNADLIERALAVAEERLGRENLSPSDRRWYALLESVLADMLTGQRTESDLGEWIAEYEIADAMGIDERDLRRRGVL